MELSIETIGEDVTKVVMIGRLDLKGAAAVDMQLSVIAGSRRKVVFDLSQVTFLASMGIRALVMSAKAIKAKGGKSVLLGPDPDVEKVLVTSAIDTIIPIVNDVDAALLAVS